MSLLLRKSCCTNLALPLTSPFLSSNLIIRDFIFCRFAGHSHWQNVRKTKEAKDQVKHQNANRFVNLVARAVKEGGPDPKLNSQLRSVLEAGNAAKVSKSTLMNAIKGVGGIVDPYLIEVRGKGNILILFESCAEKVNKEKFELASIVKKVGFSLNRELPFAESNFRHQGFVVVRPCAEKLHSEDAAIELGLEVGAEDVIETKYTDLDDDSVEDAYELRCLPRDVVTISNKIRERGLVVLAADDRYVPTETVVITEESSAVMEDMYEKVSSRLESVQRWFDNTEVQQKDAS